MMRVNVIGTSGAGKTTLATSIAGRLGIPFLELDSVRHGPGWTETPDDEFAAIAKDFASGAAWVIDGNYSHVVRDAIWSRATHVVWVDLDLWLVMLRVVPRSLRRAALRTELWNGNRELWRNFFRSDHPIWWSLRQHGRKRATGEAAMRDPRWSHIEFVRLRTPKEADEWLARLVCFMHG